MAGYGILNWKSFYFQFWRHSLYCCPDTSIIVDVSSWSRGTWCCELYAKLLFGINRVGAQFLPLLICDLTFLDLQASDYLFISCFPVSNLCYWCILSWTHTCGMHTHTCLWLLKNTAFRNFSLALGGNTVGHCLHPAISTWNLSRYYMLSNLILTIIP